MCSSSYASLLEHDRAKALVAMRTIKGSKIIATLIELDAAIYTHKHIQLFTHIPTPPYIRRSEAKMKG